MPFDPRDFLELAGALATAPDESEQRTAISRAYYAVHLYAREQLVARGQMTPTKTGRDHRLVIKALRVHRVSDGNKVDKLRKWRTKADYRLGAQITPAKAQQAVAIAQDVWPRL